MLKDPPVSPLPWMKRLTKPNPRQAVGLQPDQTELKSGESDSSEKTYSHLPDLKSFNEVFKSLICKSNKNRRYSLLLFVNSILIILASLNPIIVLTFPRIPGL